MRLAPVPIRDGETHGQWAARSRNPRAIEQVRFDAMLQRETVGMPSSWVSVIRHEWRRRIDAGDGMQAAAWGFGRLRELRAAERAGIKPADSDGEICRKAEREARLMVEWLGGIALGIARTFADRGAEFIADMQARCKLLFARADLQARGLDVEWMTRKGVTGAGVLKRLGCDRWWRRALRKAHALLLESAAIGLGIVRAGRGCYVSDDSLRRRAGQRARNAAALANTAAVNERGEEFVLADLAARGVANSEVRRAELMTRISGFEVIANDLGHGAHFVTVTCPSRMHKWRRGDQQRTEPNPSYDGTLPNDAQRYLARQWARFRSAAARAGLGLYGFRIAEPHHDGCPHWHLLLWNEGVGSGGHAEAEAGPAALRRLLSRYFLENESPTEPGAAKHRVTVEAIDPTKGSAVAYVAKYVAKNIDGYKVGADLYGQPALESSARVEAWAATWRIRQFQQIGGAPVTVWRELRRLHPGQVPMDAADALHDSFAWVNCTAIASTMDPVGSETDEAHRIRLGWAGYVRAQGGPTSKRAQHAIRLMREHTGELGRYGEPGAGQVTGVRAFGAAWETLGIVTYKRERVDEVETERSTWLVGPKQGMPAALQALHARITQADEADQQRREEARALVQEVQRHTGRVAPWTRVNNCTPEPIARRVVRTKKRGQVYRWPRRNTLGGAQAGRTDEYHEPAHPGD